MTDAHEVELLVLYETAFYVMGAGTTVRAALLRRTAEPFPSLRVLRAENDRLIATLRRCKDTGVVVDMRAAPANNAEDFEDAMRSLRVAVGKRFARVVVVVHSAAGEMQVTRLHRSEHASYVVTRDYGEAWALALGSGS